MWRAVIIGMMAAAPVAADGVHDRLDAAFGQWLGVHASDGVLATGAYDADGNWRVEGHTHRAGTGDDTGQLPFGELASVSKSVTAACTLALVRDGLLDWSDRLPDILGDAPDVTLSELVTHTSGIGPDATQLAMGFWLDRQDDRLGHFSQQVLDFVNARPDQAGTRGDYAYNNENYALLGLVIEAVTDNTYHDACWARLDLDQGVWPSPRTMALQPWGGLWATPAGYLRFLNTHFGPDSVIGQDPLALPHVEIGGGAYYGLGMVFRPYGTGYNFWHFGALCFPDRLNVGSFAVLWEGRMAAVALYDACVDWPAMHGLDTALSRAAYAVPQ